jgi:hypothetical protein
MSDNGAESGYTQPPDQSNGEEIVFQIARQEKRILLEGEDGVKRRFVLKEGLGTLRGEWMNFMASRTKLDSKGGIIGMKDFRGMESWLIHRCLFDADTGKQVPQKDIEEWPASLQQRLFKMAQELNGLQADAAEAEKNA